MGMFFLGICVALAVEPMVFLPEPTPRTAELVKLLGNEKFAVREEADRELKRMSRNAIRECYMYARKGKDPEILMRTRIICEEYFLVKSGSRLLEMPPIWMLDTATRFGAVPEIKLSAEREGVCLEISDDHKDLARDFYAKMYYGRNGQMPYYYNWDSEELALEATQDYVKTNLVLGAKREDMKKVLDQMVENLAKGSRNYSQVDNIVNNSYNWSGKCPGPLYVPPKETKPTKKVGR